MLSRETVECHTNVSQYVWRYGRQSNSEPSEEETDVLHLR
jgi:hypothetical protein